MATFGYDIQMIRETYVAPLRSALMIDDKFPTYEDMLGDQRLRDAGKEVKPSAWDYDNLEKLLTECRQRHLLCDIQRTVEEVTEIQLDHLGKSDLVVLDYHLDGEQATNPEKAISVLQRLARTPHANLVVVYTLETPLDSVRRTVAYRFRGLSQLPERPNLSIENEEFLQFWDPRFSNSDIDAYLRGDARTYLDQTSGRAKELIAGGIPRNALSFVLTEAFEEHIRKHVPQGSTPAATPNRIEMNGPEGQRQWLSCGNVFVVFVAKNQPKSIFEELEAALLEWQPLPMKMMLAHIRNRFETGGFSFEEEILADSNRLTAWFFHALTGEEPEPKQRLKQLWSRMFDGLGAQLAQSATEFGAKVLGPSIRELGHKEHETGAAWLQKCLQVAKRLADGGKGAESSVIVHALNSFLCSEEYDGSHIRTGTVCRVTEKAADGSAKTQWFLCASPACEMMPRPPKGEGAWVHDLDPVMAVTVLRLEPLKKFQTPLGKAIEGKHIFLIVDGTPTSFQVIDGSTGHPKSEIMFVSHRGVTDADNCVQAFFIRRRAALEPVVTSTANPRVPNDLEVAHAESADAVMPAATAAPLASTEIIESTVIVTNAKTEIIKAGLGAPTSEIGSDVPVQEENVDPLAITTVRLQAVAQLRPSYADRFLHHLGQHSSRIGVDFVNSF